jgi:carbonic anhydrase/acetyltransferase-like protein (isoleucine patch superfamily)
MIAIDHGEFSDPWRGPRPMTEEPWIHETAVIKNSRMGVWTMVGPNAEVISSDIMDYAYLVKNADIFNAEVGKFANIAANVLINPSITPCGGQRCIISPTVPSRILWRRMTMITMRFPTGETANG